MKMIFVCSTLLFAVACVSTANKAIPMQYSQCAPHAPRVSIVEGVLTLSDEPPNHIVVPKTTNLEGVYVSKPILSYVEEIREGETGGETQ